LDGGRKVGTSFIVISCLVYDIRLTNIAEERVKGINVISGFEL
jgi:hypothetical protein